MPEDSHSGQRGNRGCVVIDDNPHSVGAQVFQAFELAQAIGPSLQTTVSKLNDGVALIGNSTLKMRMVLMALQNSDVRGRLTQGNEYQNLVNLMEAMYARYSVIINTESQGTVKAVLMQQFQKAREESHV